MAYIPSECSISDYEQVVYNGETKNKLYISFGGNELIDADHYCEKLTIKSRLLKNGNNYFSLDNFVSKEATLILHKVEIGKIKDPVIIELGTYIDKVQDYVYVPFGVFNIQGTPTNDKDKTTITLRDNSVNFDFDYNAKNEIDRNGGSATLYQILQDICKQAKVNCTVPSTLTGIDDKTGLYDNTIKARTYVSYIAEHCGKIATIDRNGYLIFVDLIGDAINLSGNNISIDNAIERPIETIQIDGKSTQAKRSGKNLLNNISPDSSSTATWVATTTGGTFSASSAWLKVLWKFELEVGKSYTLSYGKRNSTAIYTYVDSYTDNTYGTRKTKLISDGTALSNTFIADSKYIIVSFQNNAVVSNIDIPNIQLEKGTSATPYEQYGVSPSPDYPSEIKCVKEKNLLSNNATSKTTNGVTFTVNDDKTILVNGNNDGTANSNFIIKRYSLKAGTYILNGCPSGGSSTTYRMAIQKTLDWSILALDTGSGSKQFTIDEATTVQVAIFIQKGQTISNLLFKPMIRLSSIIDDTYVPYNTIQVKNIGKNLFDKNSSETQVGYFTSDGTLKSGGGSTITTTYTKIKPNIDMTISGIILEQICFYDENKKFIERVAGIRGSTSNTFNKNANYIRFQASSSVFDLDKIQLELGTQPTTYEPYQESITNIDLQGNEVCSLSNNVKDELVIENGKAKIIKNVGKVVLNGSEVWVRNSTNQFYSTVIKSLVKASSVLISNYFEYSGGWRETDGIFVGATRAIGMINTKVDTVSDLITWLSTHNTTVYYELATPTEIDLGEVDTLSTFKGVNNVSLDANMQTNMNLQYYKPKQAYTIPLNIVQSYEDGEDFKLSQVTYESGELYWNKGDNKNDTLYINSANPYITNQKNIDNIYNIVNGLEINSLKLKKQRGNPLLDCYDFIEIQTNNSNGLAKSALFKSGIMKSMSSNAITYKTLAQNELTYNGKIMQTFDTTITKQAKTTNVSKNNEASLKKYVKSEIDGVKGELTTVVGKVDTIDVKTNNNYQEILNMFDEYTPQSDFLELENNVTRIQTDTYTKTEINQKLTNGSVTKVLTTAGTFDNNGLTIEKTNAKTKGNFNEKGMTIKDATGSTDTELLFAGYDDILNETIVRTKNIKVEKYLTIGKNSRIEDYSNGTGVFHIGE